MSSSNIIQVITLKNNDKSLPFLLDNQTNKKADCFEVPSRIDKILDAIKPIKSITIQYKNLIKDEELLNILEKVHSKQYISFLKEASGSLPENDFLLEHSFVPQHIAADTPIVTGIFEQAFESARTAQSASIALANGNRISYALCRPPGHHAGYESMGGYCYFNNAVLAAESLLDRGIKPVGLLDIDYHFGNGSFELVKSRKDIIFISLHACTKNSYPYSAIDQQFYHHSAINFASPPRENEYLDYLENSLDKIKSFGCEALVVSLGYDIIKNDPHGTWDLPSSIYKNIGKILRETNLPLCFVQEGGYLINEIGSCAFFLFDALTG